MSLQPKRTWTGRKSHFVENLLEKCWTPSPKEPFDVEIYRKSAGPRVREARFARKFMGKVPDHESGEHVLCAPAQSKRTWTFQKTHLVYRKNAGPQFRGRHFVQACAVEMHVDTSQEPFYAVIYRKNAGTDADHLEQTPRPLPLP